MRIIFFNEFSLSQNNSAGITVRDLFGDDVCYNSLQIVYSNKHITVQEKDVIILEAIIGASSFLKLLNIIKKKKADVIYTTGNSIRALALLSFVKIVTQIPILVHYFDNWREIGHPSLKNILLRIINGKKELALVIGDEMGEHYKNKYKGEYVALMVGSAVINKRIYDATKNNKVFLYAGGFHLGRGLALLDIERGLVHANTQDIKLRILTFKSDYDKYGSLFNPAITEFITDVPHEEIAFYYNTSDVLLFVEPAPEGELTFLKYSMSTKIPEYLASGLPVICYAHPDIASTHYFEKTHSAYVIKEISDLQKAIDSLNDKQKTEEVIKQAQLAVQKDFNRDNQRKLLYDTLSRIIGK